MVHELNKFSCKFCDFLPLKRINSLALAVKDTFIATYDRTLRSALSAGDDLGDGLSINQANKTVFAKLKRYCNRQHSFLYSKHRKSTLVRSDGTHVSRK